MLTPHNEQRTTDKKRSQKLTMSTLCSEDDQVHKYENGRTYIFIEKKSLNEHFNGEAPSDINDVIYKSDNNVYIFSDDKVHIIKPSYDVEEISLDNNGNKNVYTKYTEKNFKFKQENRITGANAEQRVQF
ncbi:hypothetical protein DPMN_029464 [Dreissena polymorpha]|uniref:Uncharacterized protein n=1 Tax=Dreissena polymorpha TaxID=45954 RepID=A0A9D4RH60_DREPO|nr:hypothetical protein DPMN_029464 [Dreissena polymorpha]